MPFSHNQCTSLEIQSDRSDVDVGPCKKMLQTASAHAGSITQGPSFLQHGHTPPTLGTRNLDGVINSYHFRLLLLTYHETCCKSFWASVWSLMNPTFSKWPVIWSHDLWIWAEASISEAVSKYSGTSTVSHGLTLPRLFCLCARNSTYISKYSFCLCKT